MEKIYNIKVKCSNCGKGRTTLNVKFGVRLIDFLASCWSYGLSVKDRANNAGFGECKYCGCECWEAIK